MDQLFVQSLILGLLERPLRIARSRTFTGVRDPAGSELRPWRIRHDWQLRRRFRGGEPGHAGLGRPDRRCSGRCLIAVATNIVVLRPYLSRMRQKGEYAIIATFMLSQF